MFVGGGAQVGNDPLGHQCQHIGAAPVQRPGRKRRKTQRAQVHQHQVGRNLLAVLERNQDVIHQRNREVGRHQRGSGRSQRQRKTQRKLPLVRLGKTPQAQQHPGGRRGLAPCHVKIFLTIAARVDIGGVCLQAGQLLVKQLHQAQRLVVHTQGVTPGCQTPGGIVEFDRANPAMVKLAQRQCAVQRPHLPGVAGGGIRLPHQQAFVGQGHTARRKLQLRVQVNREHRENVFVGGQLLLQAGMVCRARSLFQAPHAFDRILMLLHFGSVPHGHTRNSAARWGAIFAEKDTTSCCQPQASGASPVPEAQLHNAPSRTPPTDPQWTMKNLDDIKLLRINYLRGPNIWTYRPVLEVWLDLGEFENYPSNLLPGFNDRLTAWLPALIEHHCGVGERGGFLQRLTEGTWAGHVLEHIVIELLNLAGMPTGFGQTRSTSVTGVYRMVFRARDEQVARVALAQGHKLIMAAIRDEAFSVDTAVAAVRQQVEDGYLGPSTACIVDAATDRRIPHIRLNDGNLVQLGYGASQRRIWTAESDMTSAIAEGIAGDKDLTKSLLQSCGVPVPEGQVVDSPAAAWEAAQDVGLPVVVKPSDANHGRGVTLDLKTQEDIEAAYLLAEPEGSEVLVERFIRGNEHRLLVVGGRVVAAARGEVVAITGDGQSTVDTLVARQLNTDPRRGPEEEFPLDLIDIEHTAVQLELRRQGLTANSVLAAGHEAIIQRNGNVAIDCTDQVHPEVEYVAALAARVVGLDIAGIDLVALDISKPLQEQGGAIVEVNAGPGLLMHLKPGVGAPRPVGQAIVEHLFPESASDLPGRIPVVGVAGTRNTATISRMVAWLLHLNGRDVGLACRDGLFLNRRCIESGDSTQWAAAHRLMVNQGVQAAVLENSAATILRDGLAYDRCQVGVVTDLEGADTLAEFDIFETEQMLRVLRTQVDVVLPDGVAVLNAEDERVAGLAPLCDGSVILYGRDPELPTIVAHCAQNGQAAYIRKGRIVLATGHTEVVLTDVARIASRHGSNVVHNEETLLAAIAAAWAMDISPDLIVAGIETFDAEIQSARTAGSKARAH